MEPLSPCGRGVGERGFERSENCGADPFGIGKDIVVPEAKDAEALATQIRIALRVGSTFRMLRSISFDDQPGSKADKIDYIIAELLLSFEFPFV